MSDLLGIIRYVFLIWMSSTGVPPSGKIRESQGKIFPCGKSGNFNIFCQESGKVRKFWSGLGEPNFVIYFRHIFESNMFVCTTFFFVSLGFSCDTCQIRAMKSGKVRENDSKSQGKSGNSNRADHWEPCFYDIHFKLGAIKLLLWVIGRVLVTDSTFSTFLTALSLSN